MGGVARGGERVDPLAQDLEPTVDLLGSLGASRGDEGLQLGAVLLGERARLVGSADTLFPQHRLSDPGFALDLEQRGAGARHPPLDRLELLADVTWTEWSRIKQLPLVRTSGAASGQTLDTLSFNFDDTWRLSVGTRFKLNGPWTLRAGLAYDQSPRW